MTGGNNAAAALQEIVGRVERLDAEMQTIKDDIKQVLAQAKADGFDPKIIRKVIALRKKERAEREEEQAMIEQYLHALGDLADLPLGQAAIKAEFE